jgi:hypothetical protein
MKPKLRPTLHLLTVGSGVMMTKQVIIAQHRMMKDTKAARCASTAEGLFQQATGAVVAAKF